MRCDTRDSGRSSDPQDRKRRQRSEESDHYSKRRHSQSTHHNSRSSVYGSDNTGKHDSINDDPNRQLFVGNVLVSQTTPEELRDFLNKAMKDSGMVGRDQPDPITQCRLTGKYGFLDFTNAHDCTVGLNLNNIPFKGENLKIGRPVKYTGSITFAKTWQEYANTHGDDNGSANQAHHSSRHQQQPQHPTGDLMTKPFREIFIGHTLPEMTESYLMDFLGNALLKLGMSNSGLENPFLVIMTNGKFAFAVTRTVEDAANLLNLNGIPFMGSNLKIERPTRFDGQLSSISFYNWDDLHRSWVSGDLKVKTGGNPSRILRLTNMAAPEELLDPAFYLDLMEDTRAECSQHGTVRSIIVPRPTGTMSGGVMYAEKDIGKVFVEMSSVKEAINALIYLKGRTFAGRTVDIKFYPEDKFRMQNYSFEMPGVIVTTSPEPLFKDQVYTAAALSKIWTSESSNH